MLLTAAKQTGIASVCNVHESQNVADLEERDPPAHINSVAQALVYFSLTQSADQSERTMAITVVCL